MFRPVASTLFVAVVAIGLAGCQDDYRGSGSRHWVAMSPEIVGLMSEKGMTRSDPILIRSYKQEAELEVWKKGRDGRYALLKTFPICRWSGQLGPKVKEGDRQAPEGYYPISPAQMNPNSNYHLSFDMGFPNAYDRQHGRTGKFLMVHGACSSAGCYSMTDQQVQDIYALVRDAQGGGQRAVQMQSYPFRMTAENLAKHRYNPNIAFWKNLKEGSDYFEVTGEEPRVTASGGRYLFNAPDSAAPAVSDDVRVAVARKTAADNARIAELVQHGAPAVKVVYADGGQHSSFRGTALAYAGGNGVETLFSGSGSTQANAYAEMSRPEAIGAEQFIPIGPDGKPLKATAVAAAQPASTPAPAVPAASPAKPATAQPAATPPQTTVVARLEPTPAPAPEEKSMFRKMLGAVGLGGSSDAQPARQEADIPLPPRRAISANSAFTSTSR
ncbi:murein L,D-transpeptidase family protein [Terrarubrum flagellatum]|uniref:murein L,D-transpeptidase family protein n=1 Tax=Terrirubrum flagellatum TaxID=2895980 RepID=UPI003144F29B